ncbi:MAG: SDR family oxidoreductase, partial [Rhodobacterales bacterium]|nr:SDR family oxidoreductase [Rhodobacterales bacterium]
CLVCRHHSECGPPSASPVSACHISLNALFKVNYVASKAAVLNHTRSVALYCAERDLNIRCNSISPAAILTPMWEPMLGTGPDRAARMAAIVADTPLRRFGQPEEVAALAVLLASDAAGYMTGADLALDGGLLAGTAARPDPAG